MIRTKKIAILAIIAMVLMMMPVQLFAASTTDVDRIYGAGRVETAIKICDAGWTTAKTVVLAAADQANLVDALAAAPLAGQEDAPILLTFKDSLSADVKAKIASLGATKVYVVGALSDAVKSEVSSITGVTVEVLKGDDRWATTKAINSKLTSPNGTFVVGYAALADALSAASYAAAKGYAIVLADVNGAIPAGQTQVGLKTYILGGSTLVADISGATRLAGANRFETNAKVAEALEYSYTKVYVANGFDAHLVDSLTGAALAAQDEAFIALADSTSVKAGDVLSKKVSSTTKAIALGGPSVVSDSVRALALGSDSGEFTVKSVKAANLIQLTVDLSNTKYDKDDLEDIGNYDFEGDITTDSGDDMEDIDIADAEVDGKTLTLTLEEGVENQSKGSLVIDSVITGKELTFDDIEFVDSDMPTVKEVKVIGKDTVKVTFSEPIKDLEVSDAEDEFEFAQGDDEYSVDTITAVNHGFEANVKVYGSFDEGTLKVTVGNGLEDYAGFNVMEKIYDTTVKKDTTAPVVTGYKDADTDSVTLIFDEDIQIEEVDQENYYHTNDSNTIEADIDEDVDLDGNELTLNFDSDNELPDGTAYVYIESGSISDLWDNENDSIKVKVEIDVDETAPTVEKVEYDNGVITVTYSEDMDEDTAEDLDNYVLKDSTGDELDFSGAVLGTGDDQDEVELTLRDSVADIDEGDYTLKIENVEDTAGNEVKAVTKDLTIDDSITPSFPAKIYTETVNDRVKLYVEYGEAMATSGNYSVLDLQKYQLHIGAATFDLGNEDNIDDYNIDIDAIDSNETVKITLDLDAFGITSPADTTMDIGRVADADFNLTVAYSANLVDVDPLTSTSVGVEAADLIAKAKDKIELKFSTAVDTVEADDFIVYVEDGTTVGYQVAEDDTLTIDSVDVVDGDEIIIWLDDDTKLPASVANCKLTTVASPETETSSGRTLTANLAPVAINDEIDPGLLLEDNVDKSQTYANRAAGDDNDDDVPSVWASYAGGNTTVTITLDEAYKAASVNADLFEVNDGDYTVNAVDTTGAANGVIVLTLTGQQLVKGDDINISIIYDTHGNYSTDIDTEIQYAM